jgi:hypothetical protein
MIENILAGFIAGAVGAFGTLWAYAHGFIKLELVERRKRKVDLVDDFFASRYVLNNNYCQTPNEAEYFNRCLARIPFVFGDSKDVMKKYDEYLTNVNDTSKLIELAQIMASSVGIRDVNATYLKNVQSINNNYAIKDEKK